MHLLVALPLKREVVVVQDMLGVLDQDVGWWSGAQVPLFQEVCQGFRRVRMGNAGVSAGDFKCHQCNVSEGSTLGKLDGGVQCVQVP